MPTQKINVFSNMTKFAKVHFNTLFELLTVLLVYLDLEVAK